MNAENKYSAADEQKILTLALQSLSIQATLVENQIADLSAEMRTLERDDEIEKCDRQLTRLRADYTYFQQFLDPNMPIDLESLYYED